MSSLVSVSDTSQLSKTAGSFASTFVSSPKPPVPKFVSIMSSFATATSSFSLPSVVGRNPATPSDIDSSPGGDTTAAVVNLLEVDEEPTSDKVLSVWDLEHIQKHGTTKANQAWKCLWCNMTFKQWNATKVLYHLVQVKGKDVRICRANHDAKSKVLYRSLLKDKDKSLANMETRASKFHALVGEGQQSLAVMFEAGRQRVSNGGGTTAVTAARARVFGNEDLTVEASTASQLTMSIADFIHSTGLSFSATQGQHFQNILKFARGVPSTYKPPSRNSISTTLLRINYNRRIEK
jgi:hypothetical protein